MQRIVQKYNIWWEGAAQPKQSFINTLFMTFKKINQKLRIIVDMWHDWAEVSESGFHNSQWVLTI